jgi:hypothetical protein
MGNYSVEELAHMDRLRYKPKNITKEGLIDVSAELLQHFIAQGRNLLLLWILLHLRILNNLCFKPLEEKTLMQ